MKKKYVRTILAACCLMLTAGAFTGCGKEEKETVKKQAEETIDPAMAQVRGELPADIDEYDKTVLVNSPKGKSKSQLTYYHKGDLVRYQTAENLLYFNELPEGQTAETYEKIMAEMKKTYNGLDGMSEDYKKLDDRFVEWLIVDFETIDREKAKNMLGMILEGDGAISLSKSVEGMQSLGYKKK
ncbi:MAG: DUF1307 domain-containing protein [Eubacteriales bacterium]|nr:DUF1307 domain-containing protein [Eubacteriales bacterium]